MYVAMPPIHKDQRFDQVEPETALNFLNMYSLSAEHGTPPGTLGTGPIWVASHFGGREFAGYYEEQMWQLENVGLLAYDDIDGWRIPDYHEWNEASGVPIVSIRPVGQLTLTAMPSAEFASPLTIDQRQTFAVVWESYPSSRRGSRFECEKTWAKINPDPAAVGRIITAIDAFKLYDEDWIRGAVPQFRRFLQGRFWLSAPAPPTAGPNWSGQANGGGNVLDRSIEAGKRASATVWGEE